MKKNLSVLVATIGIASIVCGIFLIKTLENPNEFMLTLSYICIGVGCVIFGHGMGNFITIKTAQNNPEIKNKWILFVKMKEISLYLIVQKPKPMI